MAHRLILRYLYGQYTKQGNRHYHHEKYTGSRTQRLYGNFLSGNHYAIYTLWKYQVYPRGSSPGQLKSGMIFCAKSPTLGDKLLSNFPRGRGGAMGRGSFHVKVLVLFIKNGRLPLQLIKKKIPWKCRRTFCESFVVVFVTYRHKWRSLKILDNISVILSTKVRKNMIQIHLLAFHPLQALGAAKGFINLIIK